MSRRPLLVSFRRGPGPTNCPVDNSHRSALRDSVGSAKEPDVYVLGSPDLLVSAFRRQLIRDRDEALRL